MQSSLAKVVGTPQKGAWAQVHSFSPEEYEKREARGELIAVLALEGGTGPLESLQLGREIITRLHEEYFGKLSETPHDQLQQAFATIVREFSETEVTIVGCVLWKDYVYFATLGKGAIALQREQKLVKILQGKDKEVTTLSGNLREEDYYILGTNSFFGKLKKDEFAQTLSAGNSIQDVRDYLISYVGEHGGPTTAGVVIALRQTEVTPEEQLVASQAPPKNFKREETLNKSQPGFFKRKLIELAERLPDRDIYVVHGESSKKRSLVMIGIILLILLFTSIFFGLKQKESLQKQSQYIYQLEEAESLYQDAILQKEVNPGRSRELFANSQTIVSRLGGVGIDDPRLTTLRANLEKDAPSLLGKVEVQAEIVADLSLVRSNVGAQEILIEGENLVVLDRAGQRLILSTFAGKETSVIGGPEKLQNARSLDIYSKLYIFLDDRGIVSLSSKGVSTVLVPNDSEWGGVEELASFCANIYLLTREGKIWRSPGTDTGLGGKQAWLIDSSFSPPSGIVDMAIDGSIWLATDSEITRFTRGKKDSFVLKSMDGELREIVAVYTDSSLDNMYILDKSGNIWEIAKTGQYQKRYETGLAASQDLAVSNKEKKIFLLSGNKILGIDLK